MGFSRRLSLTLVLFCSGWVFETVGRAIPNPDAAHSGSGILRRADTFVTMYNLFDPPSMEVHLNDDGSPRLRPIAAVLETMRAASLVATPPPTSLSAVDSSPATPNSFIPLPFHPGPVLPPSSSSSSNPGVNDLAVNNSNATVARSKYLTVLGIIIGGMLLLTVCVCILMSPPESFLGCARLKRAARKEGKPPKESSKEPEKALQDSPSWVAIPSPSTLGKRASIETVIGEEPGGPIRDTVIDVVAALSSSESNEYPISKFSMCSSEYPPSSTYTSDLASNSSTVKGMPATSRRLSDASATAKPIRPPRPPTADSPALSDSVYVACSDSDQPYVIVAPQPLTDDDLLPGTFRPKSLRKLLTSTQFAALHLRIAGGRGMKRSSIDSHHSRTKSAPAVGRRNRTSWLKVDIPPSKSLVSAMKNLNRKSSMGNEEVFLEDIEGDSDVQESMIRRVMKHRRSRSASGWAYPSKGRRARRPFKLEEE